MTRTAADALLTTDSTNCGECESRVRLRCVSIGASVLPSGCNCETTRLKSASGLRTPVVCTVRRRPLPQAPGLPRPHPARPTESARTSAQGPGSGGVTDRHPYDQRLSATIGEELPHGIRYRTVAVEPAVAALEVGEARDRHGLVGHALAGETDERRDRGRDTGDGPYAARYFLNVDARISYLKP